MNCANTLKSQLSALAEAYAAENKIPIDQRATAVIFQAAPGNLFPDAYSEILKNKAWAPRLKKRHSHFKEGSIMELHSSNSSDALLMSIFCAPEVLKWKGIHDLLRPTPATSSPVFGKRPAAPLKKGGGDATEIDMEMGDLYVEAKLTEADFANKDLDRVLTYRDVEKVFELELLTDGKVVKHYQIVRNLLATITDDKRHRLFCDARRPDLVRSYYEVVAALKRPEDRSRCAVTFWQEIAARCGKKLRQFLLSKYGL